MPYNIRIQGIEQNKDDLYEVAIECLGPLANYSKEEMSKELDHIYRLHTAVTRCANAPPEIRVRFCRRCIKDMVLKDHKGNN